MRSRIHFANCSFGDYETNPSSIEWEPAKRRFKKFVKDNGLTNVNLFVEIGTKLIDVENGVFEVIYTSWKKEDHGKEIIPTQRIKIRNWNKL